MYSKWTVIPTILTAVLCVLMALVPSASGECCAATSISYRLPIESKKQCEDYGGWCDNYRRRQCLVYLCGSLHKPTPCCGRGRCNLFCCNCNDGCWYRNGFAANDFRDEYRNELSEINKQLKVLLLYRHRVKKLKSEKIYLCLQLNL